MNTSLAGRAFIEKYEGCILHTYKDQRGILTIGIGCTGPEARPGRVITQAQADQMFADRLAHEFEPGVEKAIGGAPTTQPQFDALVSLAFNVGVGAVAGSSAMRLHKAGDYQAAADAFLPYDKVRENGVLVESAPHLARRKAEAAMYLSQAAVAPKPTYDRYIVSKAIQAALLPVEPTLLVDGKWGQASRAAYDKFNKGG